MPSPFPGMDPYLEGYLWPDVHQALANKIRQLLGPQLQPRYVARLAISVVQDEAPEAEVGIMYPEVEIVKSKPGSPLLPEPTPFTPLYPPPGSTTRGVLRGDVPVREAVGGAGVAVAAPLTISLPRVRLVNVEIRDAAQNVLVTSIEILSPINKREPNLSQYRQKRARLRAANVHLLEIDLLRRGTRAWGHPRIPETPYLILLTRAQAEAVEIWPVKLQDTLPSVSAPLRPPDADVVLDLSAALREVYAEAFYHLSIDYTQAPPPPPLSDEDAAWLKEVIKEGKLK